MSHTPSHSLVELVHALHDGIAFYDEAQKLTNDSQLADTYARLRRLKTTIASDLNAEIAMQGEKPHGDGTWAGAMRKGYADIAARMSSDPDQSFLDHVEAQEDRVLDAFRIASASDQSVRVRELAKRYLPEVQRMHDEIRRLQHAKPH